MTTLENIAERARRIILGGKATDDAEIDIRELIQAIPPLLSVALHNSWLAQKADGTYTVNGDYVYSFDNQPLILDAPKKMYYLLMPSNYIDLPNHTGITMVAKMESQNDPLIPVTQEFLSLSRGLPIANLQGRSPYMPENNKLYLPYVTLPDSHCTYLIKLVCGLDAIDEEEPINIPTDVQQFIVDNLVQKFAPEQAAPKDVVNDNLKLNPQVK